MTDISLFEAIHTQRAIRRFSSEPVADGLIDRMIEAAIRAPSGTNRQPWAFLVIRGPETKRQIAGYYHRAWDAAFGDRKPGDGISSQVYHSARHLAENMADVPVLIVVCTVYGEGERPAPSITQGSSIYPAVQNLMLAARALGLGTALTSMHRRYEAEIKSLLGIPDHVDTAALIPVGYPGHGDHFGGSVRRPAAEVTFYESWGTTGT
jgi:nitroreductase